MSTNMDDDIDSMLVSKSNNHSTQVTNRRIVDPSLRDHEEQIVVDKIINEGNSSPFLHYS